MDLTVGNQQGGGSNPMLRDYRKGNWNIEETMVLIEAKKMDDERRMRKVEGKPTELRWKWVEDYCWNNGCLRSQNQCNDKWDNLMRDFKKVRDYERRQVSDHKSYWRIEKNERKDNNLPSNMLFQIYERLVDVVERRAQAAPPPPVYQYTVVEAPPVMSLPSPAPPPPGGGDVPSTQPLPISDSDTSEYNTGSPAKRRKRRGGGSSAGEGTSGGGGAIEEIGSAISKSGSMIAEAIQSCEEREERRHREVLSVHERRLQIEESKAEMNKQGINGLVDAINNLANSIFALAAHNNNNLSPPPK